MYFVFSIVKLFAVRNQYQRTLRELCKDKCMRNVTFFSNVHLVNDSSKSMEFLSCFFYIDFPRGI